MRVERTMMKPSNDPDIALAQEWVEQLQRWIQSHGLKGYDPFDIKQHAWIRAAQPYFLPRKITTALCDLFPTLLRKLLRVAPTENPKAHALVALGDLRMYQLTEIQTHLDNALAHLQWLEDHATPGYNGLCWGYPFDIHAKGLDTPKGTPVLVISAIAGEAFVRAHEIAGEKKYLQAARSITEFILKDLPCMRQEDGAACFAYTPNDRRRVHNANLLAAEHLIRVWAFTKEEDLYNAANAALQFSLQHQREDGAWYYGEYDPEEPYEEGNLRLIDNHHTGFVLRSLHNINKVLKDENITEALKKGFSYYKKLFTKGGMPINDYGKYPVDIHACAEGILCPAVLSETLRSAKSLAFLTIRWPHFHLRNFKNGAPWYRKYPFMVSRITFPRWGVAWMYWAITEYLYHFH